AVYPRQDESLFLYCRDAANVGELHRQSLRLDVAAGERRRGAVVLKSPRAATAAGSLSDPAGGRRQHAFHFRRRALSGVSLHLAAVDDPAGAGGAGAATRLAVTGISRSGGASG